MGKYVVQYTRIKYPEFLPEALYYLVMWTITLCEEVRSSDLKRSDLNNNEDIYSVIIQTFKSSYGEMIQILKKQNRTLKLNKMTRAFAISPSLSLWLNKVYRRLSELILQDLEVTEAKKGKSIE